MKRIFVLNNMKIRWKLNLRMHLRFPKTRKKKTIIPFALLSFHAGKHFSQAHYSVVLFYFFYFSVFVCGLFKFFSRTFNARNNVKNENTFSKWVRKIKRACKYVHKDLDAIRNCENRLKFFLHGVCDANVFLFIRSVLSLTIKWNAVVTLE